MVSATPRQMDALRFIAGFIETWGCAPTRQELAEGLGLASKGAAQLLLDRLLERGLLVRNQKASIARDLALTEQVSVPRAPDGAPLHVVTIVEASHA